VTHCDRDFRERILAGTCQRHESMIRKSVKRFSEKHALGPDPGDHAQSKSWSAMTIQSNLIAL